MKTKSSIDTLIKGLGIIAFVGFLCFALPHGCTRPETARRVLTEQGYSSIEITGWRPFAASEKDTFSTGFKAKSPNGSIVTGAVTSGIFKGNTVRLD